MMPLGEFTRSEGIEQQGEAAMSFEEADATMRRIWQPNPIWQTFIDARLAQAAS